MRGNGGNADFAPEMTPFAPENTPFAPENGPHSPIPILATKGIIPIPAPRGMTPRGMTPLSAALDQLDESALGVATPNQLERTSATTVRCSTSAENTGSRPARGATPSGAHVA